MKEVQSKPEVLVTFCSGVYPMENGVIPFNSINDNPLFESDMYTPTFSLSAVAMLVLKKIRAEQVSTNTLDVDKNTVVALTRDSDLSSTNPRMYTLIVSTVLEAFSILYTIESESPDISYLTKKDFKRVRENVSYIADYFSTERKYRHMISAFRDFELSFGYMENQVDTMVTHGLEVR
ncbi:gp36 [Bacillus phage W.Ph.]|uniref:Gp36 n=1 Tax=Bacillus phage W.Ph. TaxID=764595 RepID=G9B1D7_9CAUD|nr:gp36 [Bacillus phage W.Ph.]ADH03182.1 gp36 [Bacillus phage W.Ph.]